jgi:hypothetical protein
MILIKDRVEELVVFLKPYVGDESQTRDFINRFENISDEKNNAWLMLNQTERLISLGEAIHEKVKPRDSLLVLFLIICAEAVAKLYHNFQGENKSWHYTKLFFKQFCEPKDFESLEGKLSTRKINGIEKKNLSADEVIHYFYKIRCSVVHEGVYWEFNFKGSDENTVYGVPIYKTKEIIYAEINYKTIRDIVIKGAIKAINRYAEDDSKNNCNAFPLAKGSKDIEGRRNGVKRIERKGKEVRNKI